MTKDPDKEILFVLTVVTVIFIGGYFMGFMHGTCFGKVQILLENKVDDE